MDFLGDVFGYSASQAAFRAFEDINRAIGDNFSSQDWFTCKEPENVPARLPWEAVTEDERGFERQLREAVLLISQSPQLFLQDPDTQEHELPADLLAAAGAVLEADEGLRQLRFRLVPKYCNEEQFWHRYFAAVAQVKRQVQAEHAWGDFDMLDGDDDDLAEAPQTDPPSPVDLPSMRQHSNAVDSSADAAPCSSALPKAKQGLFAKGSRADQADRHHAKPAVIRVSMRSRSQSAERMVMSGDLGTSQASSLTEAALLSPRSMESSSTKVTVASPASPIPLPLPAPHHHTQTDRVMAKDRGTQSKQPSGVFLPHEPQLDSFVVKASKPSREFASLCVSGDGGGMQSQAYRRGSPSVLPGDDGHPGVHDQGSLAVAEVAVLAEGEVGQMREKAVLLHLPFRAAHLQKLADAAICSKKYQTMQQLLDSQGKRGRPGSTQACSTAQKLFSAVSAPSTREIQFSQGGLVEQIAVGMVEMADVEEMALCWTEILQEVECEWISGRCLPGYRAPACALLEGHHHTTLVTLLTTINQALLYRQQGSRSPQAEAGAAVQQASQALNKLQMLPPRLVFQDLFAAMASSSVAAAAAGTEGSHVLVMGVQQVQQVLQTTLAQASLSRSQLTKLCQVFVKLESMFQAAIDQAMLIGDDPRQGRWIHGGLPNSTGSEACLGCSADEEPAWSTLDYESWTLL